MEQYEVSWKNYYEILQVSPNAEPPIITAAYKRLAQTYHPDVAKDPAVSARMEEINEAYEVLSDIRRRARYDQLFKTKYTSQVKETNKPTNEEIIVGLMRFAAEEAANGKKRSEVADELTKKGVPYDMAAQIVSRVFEYRSRLKREGGGKQIGCGLLILVVGGIITGISYWAASGVGGATYIVTIGLFIVGAINLIMGFFRWLTS